MEMADFSPQSFKNFDFPSPHPPRDGRTGGGLGRGVVQLPASSSNMMSSGKNDYTAGAGAPWKSRVLGGRKLRTAASGAASQHMKHHIEPSPPALQPPQKHQTSTSASTSSIKVHNKGNTTKVSRGVYDNNLGNFGGDVYGSTVTPSSSSSSGPTRGVKVCTV